MCIMCRACEQTASRPWGKPPRKGRQSVWCSGQIAVAVQSFKFNDMEWSLWDRWILEGDLTVQQVLDWFKVQPSSLNSSRPLALHWACSTSDRPLGHPLPNAELAIFQ